jgi:hypothetical protein
MSLDPRHAFFCSLPLILCITGCLAATPRNIEMKTNPLIQQAVSDLARNESISTASIELVSYEEVTWPDTSLGCPHPDMKYLQVPQDGARIILRTADREFVYHSGGGQPPFLCARPAGQP